MTKSTLVPATLELRVMPIQELKPAPYNPRLRLKPTDSAFKKLQASIREFGLVEPLIWNECTGHIVGGHARLRILRALRVKEVPVSVVRLSIEREKALNLVLNNQEAQGKFDTHKLTELLGELEDLPEFDLTGFDHRDLGNLRMNPADEDVAEEETTDTVTITLEMDSGIYEQIAPQLEALIGEHDLISHVRHA